MKQFSHEMWGAKTARYLEDVLVISEKRWDTILDGVKPYVEEMTTLSRKGKRRAVETDNDAPVYYATIPDSDPF
jgi:hypothetical protein